MTTKPRRMVNAYNLVDAIEVAEIIGVSATNNVAAYQTLYPEMPRPVVSLGRGRPRLWNRPDVEQWNNTRRRRKNQKQTSTEN